MIKELLINYIQKHLYNYSHLTGVELTEADLVNMDIYELDIVASECAKELEYIQEYEAMIEAESCTNLPEWYSEPIEDLPF